MSLGGAYEDRPVTIEVIRMAVNYALQKNVLLIVSAGNSGHDISREMV